MMKKLVFIIPYFGKFNNYFQLFLNSCSKNEEIDWVIYTDDKKEYIFPKNIKVVYKTFSEIKNKIQSNFNFPIQLKTPYKLCDYRPFYGLIFRDDIKEYEYWGYCDTDIIWGNISKLLFPKLMVNRYDKLFFLGHCSIYKNNYENQEFFKKISELDGRVKEVYSNSENYSFDEEFNESINSIFLREGKNIYLREMEANIYMKSSYFKLIKYDFNLKKYIIDKKEKFLITYNNGNLEGYFVKNKILYKEEYLYIHMQSRKMKVKCKNYNFYKIIPNSFQDIEVDKILETNFDKIKKKNYNIHYFRLRSKNLYLKLKKFSKRFFDKKWK